MTSISTLLASEGATAVIRIYEVGGTPLGTLLKTLSYRVDTSGERPRTTGTASTSSRDTRWTRQAIRFTLSVKRGHT